MPELRGTVHVDEVPWRPKVNRLFRSKIRIGKVKLDTKDGGTYEVSTGVEIYIPTPTGLRDHASYFFSVSNRKGSCYARISEEDIDTLSDLLLGVRSSNDAQEALRQATIRVEAIRRTNEILIEDANILVTIIEDDPVDSTPQLPIAEELKALSTLPVEIIQETSKKGIKKIKNKKTK